MAHDVRNRPLPHVGTLLEAEQAARRPAAAAEDIAVVRCGAVHLSGEFPGVARRLRAGAVRADGRLAQQDPHVVAEVPLVGLDEIAAGRGREPDPARGTHAALCRVLVTAVAALEGLEQTSAPLLRGREVERKAGVGALEAAVDVAMPHRGVAPLVDVDERGAEERIVHAVAPLGLLGQSAECFAHILADLIDRGRAEERERSALARQDTATRVVRPEAGRGPPD